MKKAGRNLERYPQDYSKARLHPQLIPPTPYAIAKITDSTAIDAGIFHYEYEIELAIVKVDLSIEQRVDKPYKAYSICEFGNQYGNYSYGVTAGEIPAGFDPKPIPNGTPVFVVAMRKEDGEFFYLIVNTQAISGAC